MGMKLLAITSLLLGSAAAVFKNHKLVPPPEVDDRVGIQKRSTGTGVFQQLIDHDNPELGTFSQAYWYSDEFYKGPGSPIVFFTPGEIAAAGYTGYLTNKTITGLFAEAIGGAVVIMEHRYWGTSSPFTELTVKNLTYLTLPQSIADTTYFARNVRLPFDPEGTSSATNAPWVFSGGSYSGALSAWTESVDPGTFWAYHASSAVVEAVGDFWQYFAPVQDGMPKNCSTDLAKVIDHIDALLKGSDKAAKQALKDSFGLGGLNHDGDFGAAIENGPWLWQSNSFTTGYSGFYKFCDYIENVYEPVFPNATAPGEEGVGLEKALDGYAKWTKAELIPGYCAGYGYSDWTDENDIRCLNTYNGSSPLFADLSLDNAADRQWQWFLCNEPFKYWQDGAPTDRPSIVSRTVDLHYWQRQCLLFFPYEDGETYGIKKGLDVTDVNKYTGGWFHTNTTRLIWTNGQFDPWKDATVSADDRPGGPFPGTPTAPLQIIPSGIHCSDLRATNGAANPGVQAVIDNEVAVIKGWVDEYYAEKGVAR